jgi:hypothetical protein
MIETQAFMKKGYNNFHMKLGVELQILLKLLPSSMNGDGK